MEPELKTTILRILEAHAVFRRTCFEYKIPIHYHIWDDWGHLRKVVMRAQYLESVQRGIPFRTAFNSVTHGVPFGPGRRMNDDELLDYFVRQRKVSEGTFVP